VHIQNVLGSPAEEQPLAELWFGAHPTGPSPLIGETGAGDLEAFIAANATVTMGEETAAAFDGKLPFLMKLLAPGQAVSLQVHPSKRNGQLGFERENAAGIPLSAPNRSFKDTNHKPEMVFAITDFEGLVGFRDLDDTLTLLGQYEHTRMREIHDILSADASPAGVRACLRALVTLDSADVDCIIDEAVVLAGRGTALASAHATAVELAQSYPGDAGTVASIMLNRVAFAPGECIFVPSGMPHAYLGGLAVEIMANSDNVFRAGLTSKYVDVESLLENVLVNPGPVDLLVGEQPTPVVRIIRPAAREFELIEVLVSGDSVAEVAGRGPRIVLCTSGDLELWANNRTDSITLAPGEAAFASDDDGALSVAGTGQAIIAGVPAP
jgi:mannose-6-phosphate isomerase